MHAHESPSRRQFLRSSLGAAASTIAAALHATEPNAPASERIRVGCVGVQGRASFLTQAFAKRADVEIVAVCDLDQSNLAKGLAAISKITGKTPAVSEDYRRLIDRKDLDVVVVGTPDHWHAIPTILACQSGKDVYVEKPDGHNIVEGQRMVAALKKHKRIVQLGTQSRSNPNFLQAIQYIREGHLGKCLVAKAWESAKQGSIGHPPDGNPPPGVDYDLWLGPAPKRPFNPKRFHGNWRWFFDYGTGDLGNDGVHRLDVARWALSTAGEAQGEAPLGLPTKISALGGKWYFDDDQQFPDTMQVNYEFAGQPGKILAYEMRLWAPYHYFDETEGAVVFGDKGYIILGNTGWRAYGPRNKLVAQGGGRNEGHEHIQNFLECVKSRNKPNADLETVGHPSSLLCHAGNIACRVGRQLTLDLQTEQFLNDPEANALRTRPEYRSPYLLPEV